MSRCVAGSVGPPRGSCYPPVPDLCARCAVPSFIVAELMYRCRIAARAAWRENSPQPAPLSRRTLDRMAMLSRIGCAKTFEAGQTIGLCRLLPRAFHPRNFMKNRCLRWGMLQLANRPKAGGFSTLSLARRDRPRTAMVCPTCGNAVLASSAVAFDPLPRPAAARGRIRMIGGLLIRRVRRSLTRSNRRLAMQWRVRNRRRRGAGVGQASRPVASPSAQIVGQALPPALPPANPALDLRLTCGSFCPTAKQTGQEACPTTPHE